MSVSDVVLAISVPASMNINSIDQLVALAKAQPGKLNAAAATGISDFLLFGWIKDMDLQIVKVPYRDIMQAPNDLAEERIQVLSTSLGGGAAADAGWQDQGSGRHQQAARPDGARTFRRRPRSAIRR